MDNKAAEIGPQMFSWWPDWRGEAAAIVACGPSAKRMRPELLKGRCRVIAIKEAIDLCPFADVLYGCDGPWWEYRLGPQGKKLPETALRMAWAASECARYGLHKVSIEMGKDEILTDKPMTVGNGGNSGFQAINLAVQFGVRDLLLIAFDMNDYMSPHWYGRNKWDKANNPLPSNFKRWQTALQKAAPVLKLRGIDVTVVSDVTEVKCFPKTKDLDGKLKEWGL